MLRVLIADDEIDARDNMIALIDWKSRGMKVIAAVDDGLSAYETIAAQQPMNAAPDRPPAVSAEAMVNIESGVTQ